MRMGFYILSSSPSPNFPSVKYAHNIKYIFITESVGRREGGEGGGGGRVVVLCFGFFPISFFFNSLCVSDYSFALYREAFLSLPLD